VKKVSVGLVRRDPPLEHHPARARPGEPVAVPGGFGRVAVTSGTGGVEKVGEVICFRTIYASAVPTWRNSSNTASRARARAAAYADGSALPGTAPRQTSAGRPRRWPGSHCDLAWIRASQQWKALNAS
jgi:hypothetical protein